MAPGKTQVVPDICQIPAYGPFRRDEGHERAGLQMINLTATDLRCRSLPSVEMQCYSTHHTRCARDPPNLPLHYWRRQGVARRPYGSLQRCDGSRRRLEETILPLPSLKSSPILLPNPPRPINTNPGSSLTDATLRIPLKTDLFAKTGRGCVSITTQLK